MFCGMPGHNGAFCCCGHGHGHGAASCCGKPHGHGWRRFTSREERIETLEEYLEDLRKEVQAVEERIGELKKSP